jgi:hypothetical protein
MQSWEDESTRRAVESAVSLFVETNPPGLAQMRIVLQQAGLEVLAWRMLVQEAGMISTQGFERLPASDRLRLLLTVAGIPLDLPSSRRQLRSLSDSLVWHDGPHALTEIRNALVHPPKAERARLNSEVLAEAADLGAWYLELSLLSFLDYGERYANRMHLNAIQPVPWSENP